MNCLSRSLLLLCLSGGLLGACSAGDLADLDSFMQEKRSRPGGRYCALAYLEGIRGICL